MIRIHSISFVCALFVGWTVSSAADTIVLTNGRVLEGIVSDEDPTRVVIDMGVGSVTIQRSKIQSISRSNTAEDTSVEDAWRASNLTHEKYTPEQFSELGMAFRGLEKGRHSAADSYSLYQRMKQRRAVKENDWRSASLDVLRADREGAEAAAAGDVGRYYAMHAMGAAKREDTVRVRMEIEQIDERIHDLKEVMSRYMESLDQFQETFAKAYGDFRAVGGTRDEHAFIDAVDEKLRTFVEEVRETPVDATARGRHMMVQAEINGRGTAALLLDTGATTVTLSSDAADRLGVRRETDVSVEVTLADGSVVMAEPVILSSVRVGDAFVKNVAAAVLSESPAPGVDGLLGMTFLNEFIITYDASRRSLHLKKYEPR